MAKRKNISRLAVDVEMKSLKNYMSRKCRSLKTKSLKQSIPFDLTSSFLEELYEDQLGLCHYTGMPMRLDSSEMEPDSLSVDKVDPQKGYVRDNVVLCTSFANTLKGTKTVNEFKSLLRNYAIDIIRHLDETH